MALDVLKEAPITSLDQDRPIARWLKRNFAVTRDSVLAAADWNFAIKRTSLPADGNKPAFGWCYSYTQPSDCIRVIPLTCEGQIEGRPIPYEVEGGKILTDAAPALKIRYVFRNENYGVYPASFQEALAGRLGMKMAHWLTGKQSYAQIANNMYNDAMSRAWTLDAMQGTAPRAADTEWIDAR
jgi:hypothetical protein